MVNGHSIVDVWVIVVPERYMELMEVSYPVALICMCDVDVHFELCILNFEF